MCPFHASRPLSGNMSNSQHTWDGLLSVARGCFSLTHLIGNCLGSMFSSA